MPKSHEIRFATYNKALCFPACANCGVRVSYREARACGIDWLALADRTGHDTFYCLACYPMMRQIYVQLYNHANGLWTTAGDARLYREALSRVIWTGKPPPGEYVDLFHRNITPREYLEHLGYHERYARWRMDELEE